MGKLFSGQNASAAAELLHCASNKKQCTRTTTNNHNNHNNNHNSHNNHNTHYLLNAAQSALHTLYVIHSIFVLFTSWHRKTKARLLFWRTSDLGSALVPVGLTQLIGQSVCREKNDRTRLSLAPSVTWQPQQTTWGAASPHVPLRMRWPLSITDYNSDWKPNKIQTFYFLLHPLSHQALNLYQNLVCI